MSQFSASILSRYSSNESVGITCPIFSQESVADFRLEPPRISLHSDVLVLHSVLQPLFRDHGRLHLGGLIAPSILLSLFRLHSDLKIAFKRSELNRLFYVAQTTAEKGGIFTRPFSGGNYFAFSRRFSSENDAQVKSLLTLIKKRRSSSDKFSSSIRHSIW